MDFKTIAIIILALAFGYVFTVQFGKKLVESIKKKTWSDVIICLTTLIFSILTGSLISQSDYIPHSRELWAIVIILLLIGVIQFVWTNWNIILKFIKKKIKEKSGCDLEAK